MDSKSPKQPGAPKRTLYLDTIIRDRRRFAEQLQGFGFHPHRRDPEQLLEHLQTLARRP